MKRGTYRQPIDRLVGHALFNEGAPFDNNGRRIWPGNDPYPQGRGQCECGEKSAVEVSAAARKRWHREHKQAVRNAR